MQEELHALTKSHTQDLVDLLPTKSIVGCKQVYKIITRVDDSVERYKARLITKILTQEHEIDYKETFASVAYTHIAFIHSLIPITAIRK